MPLPLLENIYSKPRTTIKQRKLQERSSVVLERAKFSNWNVKVIIPQYHMRDSDIYRIVAHSDISQRQK
jgi:hypothetical protein